MVNVIDMPVKCPVAPLEFCFLADDYFRRRGIRDRVELTYVTPLDGAFTKPVCNRELTGLLTGKQIRVVTEFSTGTVETAPEGSRGGRLISYDERSVSFDLAVVIPLHGGAAYVDRSPGLGDELGFIPVDPRTLQSKASPNVFALGRRHRRADLQGRVGGPLRGRHPGRPTSAGSWPASRWTPPSTATPTASSRPGPARPCSSTSTTTPSR